MLARAKEICYCPAVDPLSASPSCCWCFLVLYQLHESNVGHYHYPFSNQFLLLHCWVGIPQSQCYIEFRLSLLFLSTDDRFMIAFSCFWVFLGCFLLLLLVVNVFSFLANLFLNSSFSSPFNICRKKEMTQTGLWKLLYDCFHYWMTLVWNLI